MRRGIVLFLLLAGGVVFAQQTENFSGHWVLAKTTPFATNPGNATLDIAQSGNDFAVTEATVVDGKKATVESRYTLDGVENVNTRSNTVGPPTTVRSTSSWNNGILTLQGTSTSVGKEGEVVRPWEREYFLSADRAALTVRVTESTPFGEAVVSQVYGR